MAAKCTDSDKSRTCEISGACVWEISHVISGLMELLSDIRAFLDVAQMAPSTFGREAVNDGHLVKRLETGGTVTLKTAERVRDYITREKRARGLQ